MSHLRHTCPGDTEFAYLEAVRTVVRDLIFITAAVGVSLAASYSWARWSVRSGLGSDVWSVVLFPCLPVCYAVMAFVYGWLYARGWMLNCGAKDPTGGGLLLCLWGGVPVLRVGFMSLNDPRLGGALRFAVVWVVAGYILVAALYAWGSQKRRDPMPLPARGRKPGLPEGAAIITAPLHILTDLMILLARGSRR